MTNFKAHEALFCGIRSRAAGSVALALLACCAVACGGGGSATTISGLDASSGGSSGGYGESSSGASSSGSFSSSSGGSSGGGEDAPTDDGGSSGGSASSSGSSSGDASIGDASSSGGSSSGSSSGDASVGDASSSGGSSASSSGGGSSSSSSGGGSSSSSSSGGSSSSSSGGSSSSSSGGADTGTTCNLSGGWALKVAVQVTWPATAVLAAGSGTVDVWALVQGTQSGDSIPGTVLPCGITLPDFNGPAIVGSPTFGASFPDSLFDGSYLTATSSTVTVSSSTPGATFTSPAEANLLGIGFANPTTAAWPVLATAQADQVDMDADGNPGVTADSKVGQTTESGTGTYSGIPVSAAAAVFGPYASELYMALRSVIALDGTLTSCTQASGAATVSFLDNHSLGCQLSTGGNCTSAETTFVDTNSPHFASTGGVVGTATFQAQKLTGTATCPNVKTALP